MLRGCDRRERREREGNNRTSDSVGEGNTALSGETTETFDGIGNW